MMRKTRLCRVDSRLYREIEKERRLLEFERGRKVTFSEASSYWYEKMKDEDDFKIIRF